ncbi:hypothetical protein B0T22DRAFT_147862 [Podospora appendiculata]|uniref:Uncharacterized protein n=1 Tax=Podospora appendiculata TaxID=314037 RepID=A0AAE0X8Y1_9PEZI|nr:hypothetical protein B0T22DRAFT_147862 [Podospora appendiculata]
MMPDDVLAVSSAVHGDGSITTLCFGTGEKPLDRTASNVYAVKFPDDTTRTIPVFVNIAEVDLPASSLTSSAKADVTLLTRLNDDNMALLVAEGDEP